MWLYSQECHLFNGCSRFIIFYNTVSDWDHVSHLTLRCYCSAMIRLKWQTRLLLFHSQQLHMHTHVCVVVVVPISFEGRGACVSSTAGVTQHGAQGRCGNVILAVNRTLKGALIA